MFLVPLNILSENLEDQRTWRTRRPENLEDLEEGPDNLERRPGEPGRPAWPGRPQDLEDPEDQKTWRTWRTRRTMRTTSFSLILKNVLFDPHAYPSCLCFYKSLLVLLLLQLCLPEWQEWQEWHFLAGKPCAVESLHQDFQLRSFARDVDFGIKLWLIHGESWLMESTTVEL